MGDHVSVQIATVAVILIGLAAGAEIDLAGYLTARYFGMKSYSLIFALIALVCGLFTAAGGYAFGRLYDFFGGYREALTAAAILYVLSAVSYLLLGPYPKQAAILENPVGTPVAAE
jgi:hypothetical protein